ncbi:MAG: hypothetical protein ACEY26_00035 [Candidatus Hodgkinia cicadicola]
MTGNTVSICKTLSKLIKINWKTPFYKGKLTDGNVTFKSNELALIDIGYTRNGILLNNESWQFKNLKVGASIKVYIELINEDELILSRRTLDEDELWGKLEDLCESGAEVEAKIINFTRRGIKLDVYGAIGAIFWTKELIALEIELRSRSILVTRVKSICKAYDMVILTPAHKIKNTFGRITSPTVWTGIVDLCDKGIWTHVDACNGIIPLSGRPWCKALNLINQLPFGEIILSKFVKLKTAPQPARTSDFVELLVNFIAEIEDAMSWERNISSIKLRCSLGWIASVSTPNRDRCCDWRSCDWRSCDKLTEGQIANLEFHDELKFELDETNARQNSIWDWEQTELSEVLCGFDYKKYKNTLNVLSLLYNGHLDLNDEEWVDRVETAWLNENVQLVSSKASWHRKLSAIEREQILKHLRSKTKVNVWSREFEWENEQNLLYKLKTMPTEDEVKAINTKDAMTRTGKQFEWNRRQSEVKNINSYLEQLNQRVDDSYHSEGNSIETQLEENANYGLIENEKPETLSSTIEIDRKLDEEWNRQWPLERERNYWDKQHIETDRSLIETEYDGRDDVRILRPVYAVIVGMDVQTTLLVAAIATKLLAYICDFSLSNYEAEMLQKDWGNSLAIKITPIALNYSLDDVLVEAGTDGYKYLRFITEYSEFPVIGVIVKVETNYAIIKLMDEIYGKLRFAVTSKELAVEVGMEVNVTIVDFNPITNDMNLELFEAESTRTILVER